MEESLPNHHEDHIAGNGDNSLTVLQFGTHSFWCLKSSTIPQQRQQRTRNGKNWRKFRRGTWRKSEVRKRWSMKQRRRAQKFFSVHWWTCDVFQNCWIGDKAPKIQRSSCTSRWFCYRRLRSLSSIHWTRNISIRNDSSKSHGHCLQSARLRETSNEHSTCLYLCQNGGCTQNYWNFPNRSVKTFGFVYHDTKMA